MSVDTELNDLLCRFEKILLEPITDSSKLDLNNIFDSLNIIVHLQPLSSTVLEKISSLIVEKLSFVNNEHLLSKFCHFLFNANVQQVQLSKHCIQKLVEYLTGAINVTRPWVVPEILNTLSALLYENVGILEKYWDSLVGPSGILFKVQDSKFHHSTEKQLAALKCVQNLCIRKVGEPYLSGEQLATCFHLLHQILINLITSELDPNDILRTKVLLTSLKGLKNLLLGWKNTPKEELGNILGLLRVVIFFGLREKGSMAYCTLYPSPVGHSIGLHVPELEEDMNAVSSQSVGTPPNKTPIHKKRARKRRSKPQKGGKMANETSEGCEEVADGVSTFSDSSRQRSPVYSSSSPALPRHQPWIYSSSSDSEFSDSESNHAMKVKVLQAKVRQAAYRALQAVSWSTEKRIMFGYWSSFLPDIPGPSTAIQGQTLLSSILKDPSPQVRTAALAFLTDLLEASKLFLSIADESCQPRTAFIPMSVTLAEVIKELHRSLLLALLAESSYSVLIQHLKCLSTLVYNVPYGRLKPGLLSAVLKHLQKVILCKDVQVQVACLTLLGSVVSVQQSMDELSVHLFGTSELDKGQEDGKGWLMTLCRNNLLEAVTGSADEGRKVPIPVQVETLQVLASLLHNYPRQTRSSLPFVKSIIHMCLKDSDSSIQFHGAKILEVVSKCALDERMKNEGSDQADDDPLSCQMKALWSEFLSGPLPACLQHPQNHSLRALCCDALSSIGKDVFPALPHNLQILCVTLLLGLSSDEIANVRGSAVRCLGIYSMYPCLQETSMFLLDVGEVVVRLLKDGNFNTSLKASWAMGNLSAALLQKVSTEEDEIPDIFLYAMCTSAVTASKGPDKIRANAVRTLGNILRFLKPQSLERELIRSVVLDSVQALLVCCQGKSSMKVQWNACYAIGTLLQNQHLVTSGALPMEKILVGLMDLVRGSSNFKVQINAVGALIAINDRSTYGHNYYDVWVCVFQSLEILQRPVDFKEVTHRDNLCEQICISIAHLLKLLQLEDIAFLVDFALSVQELLQEAVRMCSKKFTAEDKCKKVEVSLSHLAELRQFVLPSDVMELAFLDVLEGSLSQLGGVAEENKWTSAQEGQ